MSYYNDSNDGDEKGSYEIYKAEGDVLFKQGEFKKASNSYTTALEMRQGDNNCLIARSQCFLELGESDKALADADETLTANKNFIKGLMHKAEAYYQMGQFEYALVFYHRGKKLRPEVKSFRLGIQKSEEAINNTVGEVAGCKLKSDGDLSYFYEGQQQQQQQHSKQKGQAAYRSAPKNEDKKEKQQSQTSERDNKTVKQLLGELYADKEYLENLLKETENQGCKSDTNKAICDLAISELKYLDSRTEFWLQQKPMYSRKRDKKMRDGGKQRSGSTSGKRDPTKWILKTLEEIDECQANGKYEESLKKSKKTLKDVEKWSDEDVPNRHEVVANLHSCIGNAHLELGDHQKALEHHNRDLEIAKQNNIEDAKSRALDNLGRVHARIGQFDKAIEVWEDKLPLSKSALESTWLYHEIGRCHLELNKYQTANDYGKKSLAAAQVAYDDVWQLNATVLIAQSDVKLGELQSALDYFEKARDMAKAQNDKAAESAIKKALDEVNNKIVIGVKDEDDDIDTQDNKKKSSDAQEDNGKSSDAQDNKGKSSDAQDIKATSSDAQYNKGKSSDAQDNKDKSSNAQDNKDKSSNAQDNKEKSSDIQDYKGKSSGAHDDNGKSSDTQDNNGKSSDAQDNKGKSADTQDNKDKSADATDDKGKSADATDDKGKSADAQDNKEKSADATDDKGKSVDAQDNKGKSADTEVTKEVKWIIHVHTDKSHSSGTDAKVHIEVFGKGTEGEDMKSTRHVLKSDNDNFETGNIDDFEIQMNNFAKMDRILIGHDNKGFGAGWKLDKVELVNTERRKMYTFNCGRWLADNEDDKKIERELPLASEEDV